MQKQKQNIEKLQSILHECQKQLTQAQKMVAEFTEDPVKKEEGVKLPGTAEVPGRLQTDSEEYFKVDKYQNNDDVVEGVFDGEKMVAGDKNYPVPENYASKSKLIEGDALKLTVTPQGRFIYKQIAPLEREVKRGILMYHEDEDMYVVLAEGYEYNVLSASVTFYKGEPGDEAVVLVPKDKKSEWAAVDYIIKALLEEPESKTVHKKVKERKGNQLEEI